MNLRRSRSGRRTTGLSHRSGTAVARLTRRGRMNRSSGYRTDRAWAHLDRIRLRRALRSREARWVTLGLCALALLLGDLTSAPVIRQLQGDLMSESPTLLHTISVQGHSHLASEEVALATGVAKSSPASDLDREAVKANLLDHSWIRDARVLAIPNGQLWVEIEERNPLAVLVGPAPGNQTPISRLVDTTGNPFTRVELRQWEDLPRLRSSDAIASGQANSSLLEAMALLEGIADSGIGPAIYREIQLPASDSNEGWVAHSRAGNQRVILGRRDLGPRIERLALLLASDLASARVAEEIDLRFADRAVMRSGSLSR